MIYKTKEEKEPFNIWLNSLAISIRVKIQARLDRIEADNLGGFKHLKEGVYELRVHFGKGYRIYFGKKKNTFVILLKGGSKATQSKDIKKAIEYWNDFKEDTK